MSGSIDHLSDEIQTGNVGTLHGLRSQLSGIDSARGDFEVVVALCAG
jgi:hypothetical protein